MPPRPHPSTAPRHPRTRWIACLLLLAIAWPSLGPMPWVVRAAWAMDAQVPAPTHASSAAAGFSSGRAHAAHDAAATHHHATLDVDWPHEHAGSGAFVHDPPAPDASDVPGSPTHPPDHACAQCEVLKHLARCMPAPVTVLLPAAGECAFVAPVPPFAAPLARAPARLPPARGPPRSA
jgi:hypothetical protein